MLKNLLFIFLVVTGIQAINIKNVTTYSIQQPGLTAGNVSIHPTEGIIFMDGLYSGQIPCIAFLYGGKFQTNSYCNEIQCYGKFLGVRTSQFPNNPYNFQPRVQAASTPTNGKVSVGVGSGSRFITAMIMCQTESYVYSYNLIGCMCSKNVFCMYSALTGDMTGSIYLNTTFNISASGDKVLLSSSSLVPLMIYDMFGYRISTRPSSNSSCWFVEHEREYQEFWYCISAQGSAFSLELPTWGTMLRSKPLEIKIVNGMLIVVTNSIRAYDLVTGKMYWNIKFPSIYVYCNEFIYSASYIILSIGQICSQTSYFIINAIQNQPGTQFFYTNGDPIGCFSANNTCFSFNTISYGNYTLTQFDISG
jgi:hypothetical protein